MLLKVLFMLAILTNRMHSKKGSQDSDWTVKFYATAALVVLGFMFQTGYLTFVYHFCVRYVPRLWAGEEITLEQAYEEEAEAAREQRQQQQHRRNNPDGNAGWRQTFLFGGQIDEQPGQQPPDQPPPSLMVKVLGILEDVAFFFGSFVLSVFPMWRAAPRPRPVPPEPNNDDNNNNNPENGPGVVAPPVDPAAPEEDEHDGDGDDDDVNDEPPVVANNE